MLLGDSSSVSPGKGRKAHLACAAGRKSQHLDCETNSCPDLPREESGAERVGGLPQMPRGGLPTLVHKLPPAPGPLGELLRVRFLNARPFVQAVHEVCAQAVAVVDPPHGPLIVPDLGDRATLSAGPPRQPALGRLRPLLLQRPPALLDDKLPPAGADKTEIRPTHGPGREANQCEVCAGGK